MPGNPGFDIFGNPVVGDLALDGEESDPLADLPPQGPSMFGDEPAPPAAKPEAPAPPAAKPAAPQPAAPPKNRPTVTDTPPAPASKPAAAPTTTAAPDKASAAYRVIALKYRPQNFDDLVGQAHIKTALGNAIRTGKVAHAFLFSGSRGTGKTTTARIFAKALNCLSGPDPTPEPCGVCVACREIADSRDLDVLEIDGASNNGVEQIRELRGSIDNKPARDRYRIIIIDEVHMLSTAAFNALLKTLEEPPRHVKFIFATTDPHKVPETIHSRCQHYDFRRLAAVEIVDCLREIAGRENVTLGDGVAEAIAAICEGGMRDAQSRLDQLIAFRGNHVTVADLEQVFGLVSRDGLLKLVQSARQRDAASVFAFVENVFSQGKDLGALVAALTRLFRDLMIVRACGGDFRGLDLLPAEQKTLPDEARQWPQEALMLAVDLLSACGVRLKSAEFPRFVLESSLLKLCELGDLRPIDDVIAGLDAALRGHIAPASIGSRPSAPARPAPSAPISRSNPPGEVGVSPVAEKPAPAAPIAPPPRESAPAAPEPKAPGASRYSPAQERAVRMVHEVFPPNDRGKGR